MKVPISWLKDYVDITISVEELANRLTLAGMEVEYIFLRGRSSRRPRVPTNC